MLNKETETRTSRHRAVLGTISSWLDGPAFKVIGVVAGVATIALFAREIADLDGPGWSIVLVSLHSVFTACLVVALIYLERAHTRQHRRLERDARVAAATPAIHEAFRTLRDACHAAKSMDQSDLLNNLKSSLASMAQAMSIVTGQTCRLCVKELRFVGDKQDMDSNSPYYFVVETFCRHDRHDDPPGMRSEGADRVIENTDFRMIFDQETSKTYFFCNNIPELRDYQNSHMTDGDRERLPYRAAIVWPIQRARRPGQGDDQRYDIWGFLCLDTMAVDVFDEDVDVPLGAAYADTLYSMFQRVVEGVQGDAKDASSSERSTSESE